MKPIIFALIALIILLQYELWFAPGGIISAYQMHKQIQTELQHEKKYEKRNEALVEKINQLKHDNTAVEFYARNDLGMVKQGETYYQIVPNDQH